MSNTYKHKAQGKLRILENIHDPSSHRKRIGPWIKAFGYNRNRKRNATARQLTRQQFRAQSKETLLYAENNPDDTSFPLDPRTKR